jgi:hypothetical protein
MILPALALALYPGRAPARLNQRAGVAAHGFDVVSYFTEGRARRGSARIRQMFGGLEWHFASEAHRDRFTGAPESFAPRFGGFCAYGVSEGYLVDVDPEAWDIVEGRLYLNFSLAVRRRWRQDIPGRILRAEANWPRLAAA